MNDICAFQIKNKPFISQVESNDFSKFQQLREQSECVEDLAYFTEYIEETILIHKPLRVVSVISLRM